MSITPLFVPWQGVPRSQPLFRELLTTPVTCTGLSASLRGTNIPLVSKYYPSLARSPTVPLLINTHSKEVWSYKAPETITQLPGEPGIHAGGLQGPPPGQGDARNGKLSCPKLLTHVMDS